LILHTGRDLVAVVMDVLQYFHFIQAESGKKLFMVPLLIMCLTKKSMYCITNTYHA
jgi:hypothetical protein